MNFQQQYSTQYAPPMHYNPGGQMGIPNYSHAPSQSFLTPNYSQNQPSTYSGSYYNSPQTQPAFPPASNPQFPLPPRQATQHNPSNYGFAPPAEYTVPFDPQTYNMRNNGVNRNNMNGNNMNDNNMNDNNNSIPSGNSNGHISINNSNINNSSIGFNNNFHSHFQQSQQYQSQQYQPNYSDIPALSQNPPNNQNNFFMNQNNNNQNNMFNNNQNNFFGNQNNHNNLPQPVSPLDMFRNDDHLYRPNQQDYEIFHAPMVQNTSPTTTNVAGKVISDGMRNNKFTLKNEKTGQEFTCKYDDFLYLLKGDMVLGVANVVVYNGEKTLIFNEKPIVKIGIDSETIQQCFMSSQFKSGVKFFPKNAKALFDAVMRDRCSGYPENQKLIHLDEEISKLASLHAADNKFIGWLENLSYLITETQSGRLLKWWQKHRNQRKLWLLGLTNKEIYEIKQFTRYPMDKIYDMCMKDPYRIFPISMDKCEILIKYYGERVKGVVDGKEVNLIRMFQGETYTDIDTLCARILRQIFENSISKSWMYTPARYIHKRYPPYDQIKEYFIKTYPVVSDDTTGYSNIYIKYFYDAETTVAEYINKMRKQDVQAKFNVDDNVIEFTNTRITGEQKLAVENALNNPISTIIGPAGSGKCLHPDTEILMYNQKVKAIKDIVAGELIMGPDSCPREVLSTCSGEDDMWEIKSCNNDIFICNTPHVLTLRYTGKKDGSSKVSNSKVDISSKVNTTSHSNDKDEDYIEEIYDIPLDVYMEECSKGNLKVINSKLFRASIEYQTQKDTYSPNEIHDNSSLLDFLTFFTLHTNLSCRRKAVEILCSRYSRSAPPGLIKLKFEKKHKIFIYYERIIYLLNSLGINVIRDGDCSILFAGLYGNKDSNSDVIKPTTTITNNISNINVNNANGNNNTNGNNISNPVVTTVNSVKQKPELYIYKSDMTFTVTHLGKAEYCGFELDNDGRFVLANFLVTHNTTIIKELVKNLERQNVCYKIVAPTGKSVARIKKEFEEDKDGEISINTVTKSEEELKKEMDSTILSQAMSGKGIHVKAGKDVRKGNISTIHKLVYGPEMKVDHLIADEAGMFSTLIMYEFILKFGDKFHVTFIGDKNQLSPIDAGNLFRQILNAGSVKTTELTKNHRSVLYNPDGTISQENGIVKNAENIVKHMGMDTERAKLLFGFIQTNNFKVFNGDINLVSQLVTSFKNGGATADQVTIICPFNEPLDALNKECQRIFNGNAKQITDSKGTVWKVGDRIAFKVNNYDIDLMNREEGVIIDIYEQQREFVENNRSINRKVGIVQSRFQDGKVHEFSCYITDNDRTADDDKISVAKLEEKASEEMEKNGMLSTKFIRHSFAITVHSSQGSEWKYGIFFLPERKNSASNFLSDRMIYTAITRFSTSCVLISVNSRILFDAAIRKESWRADGLCERITEPGTKNKTNSYMSSYTSNIANMSSNMANQVVGFNNHDVDDDDLGEDFDPHDFDYDFYDD